MSVKVSKGRIQVSLGEELLSYLEKRAEEEKRSVASLIRLLIDKGLKSEG